MLQFVSVAVKPVGFKVGFYSFVRSSKQTVSCFRPFFRLVYSTRLVDTSSQSCYTSFLSCLAATQKPENTSHQLAADSKFQASVRWYCTTAEENASMELQAVVALLKKIASPSLAGSWDNVVLLVEPSPPLQVQKILLTNDLTPPVMQEAVDQKVNMIVSYHPPIFTPLKRITQNSWKERIVAQCLENRIAMFSPHTSWDAAVDGVNDWLIQACGDITDLKPVEQTEEHRDRHRKKLCFVTSSSEAQRVSQMLQGHPGLEINIDVLSRDGVGDADRVQVSMLCGASAVVATLNMLQTADITLSHIECFDLAKLPSLGFGMGRIGRLTKPTSIKTIVTNVKKHLELQHLQLAEAEDKEISTVAVCAGSGSSVLRGVTADLYLTGEMSHHEILDAVYHGTNVILCNHSNTERGFLKVMQSQLSSLLGGKVVVLVSRMDKDPLTVV